ncbi:Wzz/FepE/Etk N-terminal domain-containing protein [Actinacidiphila soli]|uniref:Wzz/FepE/Etk N-terminal domain-containing protein n=1 Tax=Actinacidiphila soli TaxID=2487275 RepID=UPI000FCCA4EA|nr:Wzz/FepE/Etk N-terminal domain-containing protein [Actinacidiphila soli]
MDLAEIFRVMRRRWYVLLPGLLLTAGLTVAVALMVPVTYQSQSTVVLLNSQKATVAYDGNPFLSTQTSLTGMADSLARNLNSDASIRELKAQGATGTYEAKLADNAQGPLMWLTVTGTDKAAVLASDRLLTTYAAGRLKEFQAKQSVASKAMIRMTTIVPPQNPVAQTKTRIEYLIMAGLLGFVLSMVATFYVEARKRTGKLPQLDRPAQPAAAGAPTTAPRRKTEESVGEQTLALRPPPRWSRSTETEPAAAEPEAQRSVVTVASAEPLDEESSHGYRPRTGQRDR